MCHLTIGRAAVPGLKLMSEQQQQKICKILANIKTK